MCAALSAPTSFSLNDKAEHLLLALPSHDVVVSVTEGRVLGRKKLSKLALLERVCDIKLHH
jgi:hypothetical protein